MTKVSLCIPTLNRYDAFLSKNIREYLKNDRIEEIVICDENGEDIEKILKNFTDSRIRLYKNESLLGPFRNKIKCCELSSNEWVCLIDSDNFAHEEYFSALEKYFIEESDSIDEFTIILPGFSKPNFDHRGLGKLTITKENFSEISKGKNLNDILVMMNTGNYVINKKILSLLKLSDEKENIEKSDSCDVIYLSTLLMEQLPVKFKIVPEMWYDHTVHEGSIYIEKHREYLDFNKKIIERFIKITGI
jgi:hypothetical protein